MGFASAVSRHIPLGRSVSFLGTDCFPLDCDWELDRVRGRLRIFGLPWKKLFVAPFAK